MKAIILFSIFIFTSSVFSQNITNTLGSGGLFTIKDISNTYFTLSQTNGLLDISRSLRLANTTGSTIGVINKGADRFIHNFGTENLFVGINSGNFTMSGIGVEASFNTTLGSGSLSINTTGHNNIAIGHNALLNNTSGYRNTAVGKDALLNNLSGFQNTAVGTAALINCNSGFRNTALGYNIGTSILGGSNLTLIGFQAEPSGANVTNEITLGNIQVTSLRCNVTSITSLSDARDKKNISELSLGLDFISKLKPRQFNWDKREWYENNQSDGSKMEKKLTAGFIAQELDETQEIENADWLNLVLKNNPEKFEATTGNLLPVIVKSIQELKNKNDELKAENNKLKKDIEFLKTLNEKLVKLEQMVTDLESKGNIINASNGK